MVGPYLNIHPYRRRVLHHAENMKSLKEQSSYGRGSASPALLVLLCLFLAALGKDLSARSNTRLEGEQRVSEQPPSLGRGMGKKGLHAIR